MKNAHKEVLVKPNFLEIKFYRLTSPLFNYSNLPLSGLYNPLINPESSEYQLNPDLKDFETSSGFVNMENLLSMPSKKNGKILLDDTVKNVITFVNNSKEVLILKELNIILSNKLKEEFIDLNLEQNKNQIKIPPNKSHSIFFHFKAKTVGKLQLKIQCHSLSKLYDNYYYKQKQLHIISESTKDYIIINNSVEFIEFQKYNFEVENPFIIREKLYHINVNQCLIYLRIKNNVDVILTILDLYLIPKNKIPNKIEMIKSLEEVKNSRDNKNKTDNFEDSKYITLQPREELMLGFRINNPDFFYDVNEFTLNINWLKNFDFNQKTFRHDFPNKLNTFNEFYKINIIEKPEGDIIVNQNFKITINLKIKNKEKKLKITLNQEQIQDNDSKSNDREIEIIDIIEKEIELNAKTPNNNFTLICKSDILGNVYLPKLIFTISEGDKIVLPKVYKYDSLLSFNCISK